MALLGSLKPDSGEATGAGPSLPCAPSPSVRCQETPPGPRGLSLPCAPLVAPGARSAGHRPTGLAPPSLPTGCGRRGRPAMALLPRERSLWGLLPADRTPGRAEPGDALGEPGRSEDPLRPPEPGRPGPESVGLPLGGARRPGWALPLVSVLGCCGERGSWHVAAGQSLPAGPRLNPL